MVRGKDRESCLDGWAGAHVEAGSGHITPDESETQFSLRPPALTGGQKGGTWQKILKEVLSY